MSRPSNLKRSRIRLIGARCCHERPSILGGVPRTKDERAIGFAFTCYFLIKLCSDSYAKAAERPRGVQVRDFTPGCCTHAREDTIREDENSMLSLSSREGNDSRQQHPPPYSHTNNSQKKPINLYNTATPRCYQVPIRRRT